MKILVIEDDDSIREMYKFKLVAEGFSVETASDGEEGLSLCSALQPELILLDIKMPKMDGAEMLKKLRETTWGSSIRVIILTNSSKTEAPSDLRFLNVERYIVKAHHTPKQVIDVVKEILGVPKIKSI